MFGRESVIMYDGVISSITNEEIINMLNCAESTAAERDSLKQWKEEAMFVMGLWDKVGDYIQQHPDVKAGASKSEAALELIQERDKLKEEIEELKKRSSHNYGGGFTEDEITIHALRNKNSKLKEENERLKVDRDEKEVMINAFDKIGKLFNSYEWIIQGRGPYAYDDEGYRKEVTNLYESFKSIKADTWANIKTRTHEYKDALTKDLRDINKSLVEALEKAQQYMNVFILRGEDPLVGENLKTDSYNTIELISQAKAINP